MCSFVPICPFAVTKFCAQRVEAGEACAAANFKMGYHTVPSMTPLHIHIISQARGVDSDVLVGGP